MIKFEHTEVVGLEVAIRSMKNSINDTFGKSDSGVRPNCDECGIIKKEGICHFNLNHEYCKKYNHFVIGSKDFNLMKRMRSIETDFHNIIQMIVVYVDITAPLYWWSEFDEYKVGTVENSCSTMHKIQVKEFTLEDFSREHLNDDCVACNVVFGDHSDCLTSLDILKYTIEGLNCWRKRYLSTKNKDDWWQMIQLLPSSYNQKRTVMMNYEILSNIYKSCKNNKMDEWSEIKLIGDCPSNMYPSSLILGFCDWIKMLPYSELITNNLEEKEND